MEPLPTHETFEVPQMIVDFEPLTIDKPEIMQIIIPECCRENWPTCPHIPKRQRKVKKNIGL